MERIAALAEYLGIELEDAQAEVIESSHSDNELEYGTTTYLVLTDEEADEKAKQYIKESLWAFNPDFLSGITGLPVQVFTALSESMHEDANETILQLVGDNFDQLVSEAISSDGRGHFMNTYDGKENVLGDYYIYRMD